MFNGHLVDSKIITSDYESLGSDTQTLKDSKDMSDSHYSLDSNNGATSLLSEELTSTKVIEHVELRVSAMYALPEVLRTRLVGVGGTKPPKVAHGDNKTPESLVSLENGLRSGKYSGVGLLLGRVNGVTLVGVDIDGVGAIPLFESLAPEALPTWELTSGVEGRSTRLYKVSADVEVAKAIVKSGINNEGGKAENLELLATHGNYCLLPTSLHPGGLLYVWVEGCKPKDVLLAELPDSLLALVAEKAAGKKAAYVPKLLKVDVSPSALAHVGGVVSSKVETYPAIPLERCLSLNHRDLVANGASEGDRKSVV